MDKVLANFIQYEIKSLKYVKMEIKTFKNEMK